jgi:hypothetical protein
MSHDAPQGAGFVVLAAALGVLMVLVVRDRFKNG